MTEITDTARRNGLGTNATVIGRKPRNGGQIKLTLFAANTIFYQAFMFALSLLPMLLAVRLSEFAGRLRYWRRKNGVLPLQGKMALGLKAEPERAAAWWKRSFELAAREDMGAYIYPRLTKQTLNELINLQGLDKLPPAFAHRKGALLYCGP